MDLFQLGRSGCNSKNLAKKTHQTLVIIPSRVFLSCLWKGSLLSLSVKPVQPPSAILKATHTTAPIFTFPKTKSPSESFEKCSDQKKKKNPTHIGFENMLKT